MHSNAQIVHLTLIAAAFVASNAFGQIQYEAYEPGSSHELITLAAEQRELIERRGFQYVDAELQAIVDRVALEVLPTPIDQYVDFRIFLIRDPSPVSFSLADGQIYIHTGLLSRLQSEGQLAAVIAHEAHHVAAHHHFRADKSRRSKATGVGVTGMVAEMAMGGALPTGFMAAAFSQSFRTKFDESLEMEADAQAVDLVTNAGYAKATPLEVLDSITRDPELASPGIVGSWTTLEELEQRRTHLLAIIGDEQSATADPRPLILRNLIEITIDDYIRLDRAGVAVEWIDALISLEPDAFLFAAKGDAHEALGPRPNHISPNLKKSELRKMKRLTRDEIDEKYLATPEGQTRYKNNRAEAIVAYTESIHLDPNNARAHLGLGRVYFEEQNYRQSGRHLLTYLKLKPDAINRELVLEKLQHIRNEIRTQKETQK